MTQPEDLGKLRYRSMNLRDERAVTKTIGCDGIDFIVLGMPQVNTISVREKRSSPCALYY